MTGSSSFLSAVKLTSCDRMQPIYDSDCTLDRLITAKKFNLMENKDGNRTRFGFKSKSKFVNLGHWLGQICFSVALFESNKDYNVKRVVQRKK